jgi:uncharacterized protein (DUF2147 family)
MKHIKILFLSQIIIVLTCLLFFHFARLLILINMENATAKSIKTKTFIIFSLCLFMCVCMLEVSVMAQNSYNPDALCGEWWTPGNDGRIIFFKNGTTYSGKVSWIKKNIDTETGKPILDKHNPDPALRIRPIQNLVLFYNFAYSSSKEKYIDGKLYDSNTGNTYSCWIKLIDKNVLELHGFVGFSLIGKSVYFTRVQK